MNVAVKWPIGEYLEIGKQTKHSILTLHFKPNDNIYVTHIVYNLPF